MKNKCKCYHTQQKTRYTYNQFTGSFIPHDVEVGVCWGTKETDECNCDGDETKCNFYPEVRAKAKKEITIEDAINHFKYGISHDIFSEPVTTYAEMAVKALKKQIALKTLERDYVPNGTLVYGHCPKCDTFTNNHEEYCYKCGQKLDWK